MVRDHSTLYLYCATLPNFLPRIVHSYLFRSVVYDGQFMPCIDAITAVAKGKLDENIVMGHKLIFDSDLDTFESIYQSGKNVGQNLVRISQNGETSALYYVPHENNDKNYSDPANIGQYANDLGFATGVNESIYVNNAIVKNSLMFAWKVTNLNGFLVPICPVLVTAKDVFFKANKKTIEIGVRYR